MRNTVILAALALATIPGICSAQVRLQGDDLIRETQVTYVVEHEDGAKETVLVKYEAQLAYTTWQTGSASVPLKGKLEDDRKCHFSANARVYRRAYVLTRSGATGALEGYQAIYQAHHKTGRGPDNFFEALSHHVTCGDVNLFRDRVENAKAALISHFDTLIAADDDKSRERLKNMLLGAKITLAAEQIPSDAS